MRLALFLFLFFAFAKIQGAELDEEKIVQNMLRRCKGIELSEKDLKKTVHFIEDKFSSYRDIGKYFLPKEETGLLVDLEFDPNTRHLFIHLGQEFLISHQKRLQKSIVYRQSKSYLALLVTSSHPSTIEKEIGILKQLKGVPHIVPLLAAFEGPKMLVPFCKQGDLRTFIKEKSLSLAEKVSIARDLMLALDGIHKKGITHGDLHLKNLLLVNNNDKTLSGIRYRIALIDWEKSGEVDFSKYQGRKDLYAAGCMLHAIFHNLRYDRSILHKLDAFQNQELLPDSRDPLLLGEVSSPLTQRKQYLDRKQEELTAKERFEYLILLLLHPEKQNPKDAAYFHRLFQELLFSFKKAS